MKIRLSTLLILITVAAALFSLAPLMGPRSILLGFKYEQHLAYQEIEVANPAESAISLLGIPMARYDQFPRQLSAFEDSVARQKRQNSQQFLIWANGGNWFYCVGVDKNGAIVFKVEGHS